MVRRWLKLIALGLIILPEPVTTALGIILLTVLLALPGHQRLSKFKNLEELVKKSRKNRENADAQHWTPPEKSVVFHELSRQATEGPAIDHPEFQANAWFDNRRVSRNILHHTLDHSFPQYEASIAMAAETSADASAEASAARLKAGDSTPDRPTTGQKVKYHTLKTDYLPLCASDTRTPAIDGWKKHFSTPDEVVLHTLKTSENQA